MIQSQSPYFFQSQHHSTTVKDSLTSQHSVFKVPPNQLAQQSRNLTFKTWSNLTKIVNKCSVKVERNPLVKLQNFCGQLQSNSTVNPIPTTHKILVNFPNNSAFQNQNFPSQTKSKHQAKVGQQLVQLSQSRSQCRKQICPPTLCTCQLRPPYFRPVRTIK